MPQVPQVKDAGYKRLLERVFSGSFAPGSKLVEQTLADELGISRSPVRQSLTHLVAQGVLVGGRKGQGAWLRRYSLEEVRELYNLREWLEAGAAYYAATARTETDLERLEFVCEQMEQAIDSGDGRGFPELDLRFHTYVVEASHNGRFIHLFDSLLLECDFVFYGLTRRRRSQQEGGNRTKVTNWRESMKDHHQLMRHLREQDAEGAEAAVRHHIQAALRAATRLLALREAGDELSAAWAE